MRWARKNQSGGDQRLEQGQVLGVVSIHPLGMPLDGHQEGMIRVLDGLDDAVLHALGGGAEARGEILDELVVGAGHPGFGDPHDGVQARVRQNANGMNQVLPVLVCCGMIG